MADADGPDPVPWAWAVLLLGVAMLLAANTFLHLRGHYDPAR